MHRFGLIFTAIEGQNFCKSCFSTFGFLFANPTQVAINALVGMLLYLMIAFGFVLHDSEESHCTGADSHGP